MAIIEHSVSRLKECYEHLARKAELQELRGELHDLENRLMLRLGGLMIGGFGIVVGLL